MSETSQLHREIVTTLDALCRCWNESRILEIEALWDRDEAEPHFLPAEVEGPLTGWADLRGHYRRASERLEASSMRIWNISAKLIAPDVAMAIYEFHWDGAIKGRQRPAGLDSRATVTLRRRSDGWRFISYVEAPLAFAIQLQLFQAQQSDPDFLERSGRRADVTRRFWSDGSPMPVEKIL
jgi:ketosteroid isomerase-like protein